MNTTTREGLLAAVDFGIARFGKGPFLVRSVSEPHGAVLKIPSPMAGIPL